MIACVIHGARELKIENRPEPPHPQDGEVLVRFGAGGICGSDLHYYHEGGILDFKIREPLVLGHEVAGEVVEIGPGVTKVSVGQRVAVNPLRSCLRCVYCLSGRPNLCLNRRFFGSAARFPHVQGMFAELFIASEAQCVTIPELTPFRVAACAEPLRVTLHAVAAAGAMLGRKVLVTGSGPIGVLVAASARLAGAAEIVVTDLYDEALAIASRMVAKELELIGTFLSCEEFRWAVETLVHGRIDIGPILTGQFSLGDASSAFELASDRSKAMKVSLVASA
jgi:L-idonate 5-dehydrogenase